jgi:predicted alpha/beta hydrolase
MWDGKASVDVTRLSSRGLARYGEVCALTLARAHARTGFRISITAYLGDDDEFDEAVADFAASYADVTEADHARLVAAIESGRIEAADQTG